MKNFIEEGLKVSSITRSGNGSLKYKTSQNDFVDDFANIAYYLKPRTFDEVSKTMQLLWSQNPLKALKLSVYMRMITRKVVYDNNTKSEEIQKGQGLKNEGILRMLWIGIYHPIVFKKNIPYFIAAGSWKDIFTLLSLDLQLHGWDNRKLDWPFLFNVIKAGLVNENTTHLVRKYLPTIRNAKNCTTEHTKVYTIIGRWIANKLFSDKISCEERRKLEVFTMYRQLKAKGLAHQWQQKISQELYTEIDFDTIAGKALKLLVNSKFLDNHDLTEQYSKWISNKSTAKYTGFVFDLFGNLSIYSPQHVKDTINAQFQTLVEQLNSESNLLVVRDISGSMSAPARGCNMSSGDIAKAMALYFSQTLKGHFANTYAVFAKDCELRVWKGETVYDKWLNDVEQYVGDTDFLQMADLLIRIKQEGVSEEEFPNGLLLVSDGEFDITPSDETNFQVFRNKLRNAGFSEEFVQNFKLILWDIPNMFYGNKESATFEDFAGNNFYISGYDPSAVSFILGNGEFPPTNTEDIMNAALDQELLNRLTIPVKKKPTKKKYYKKRK